MRSIQFIIASALFALSTQVTAAPIHKLGPLSSSVVSTTATATSTATATASVAQKQHQQLEEKFLTAKFDVAIPDLRNQKPGQKPTYQTLHPAEIQKYNSLYQKFVNNVLKHNNKGRKDDHRGNKSRRPHGPKPTGSKHAAPIKESFSKSKPTASVSTESSVSTSTASSTLFVTKDFSNTEAVFTTYDEEKLEDIFN
ncbi:hypothetical protein LPJ66_008350 [Kickxella alabastrina]|uniref:Uncharacterized protein n=1 Tax=Kickxella alabastrina TaxID=61397 RepID=A0ACC1I6L0_9FUNG|nr:hypothetical protein LPJ66_008350 [Kickxella alabastrina]